MLTKLKIYNLAYAELLRKRDVESQRKDSVIKRYLMKQYDEDIEELHMLILIEEGTKKHHVNAN